MHNLTPRSLSLFLLAAVLLVSCGGGVAVDRPAIAPGAPVAPFPGITQTMVEKVVSLSTLTSVPAGDPNMPMGTVTSVAATQQMAATLNAANPPLPGDTPAPTQPPIPGSTPTPLARIDVLEGTGIEIGMIADSAAGIQLSFPAGWSITPVDEAVKAGSKQYTTFIESPGEAYTGGGPMRMALTVMNENNIYEESVKMRLKFYDQNRWSVINSEDWTLDSGEPASVWWLDAGGQSTAEILTVIDGRTIILSATGDLFLFNPIAASLQRLTTTKPGG